jgi:hypothetical protein
MDRTVPKTGSEDIELYMRTYYSLLRSSHTIQIETLVESHLTMDSSLHVLARSPQPDVSTLVYSSMRMPSCIIDVDTVILGQLEKQFIEAGYPITDWEKVYSTGRRRRTHFDAERRSLAVFIVSRSDIDDLIPMLTAYQIEWNKLHNLLQGELPKLFLTQHQQRQDPLTSAEIEMLANALHVEPDDLRRLEVAWGNRFILTLNRMAHGRKQFGVRLLAGSLAAYRRATAHWWDEVCSQVGSAVNIYERPVYFVSSNAHSLVNPLTGFAVREEKNILHYIQTRGHQTLLSEYNAILANRGLTHKHNFLYYVLKKYLSDEGNHPRHQMAADEREVGIYRIPSQHGFDIETQVIEINKLRADWLDPRITNDLAMDWLPTSDALIINIDYPLGLGAYEILTRLSEQVLHLIGVYVMGKAATLNGRIGDVMISNVVHDEHSQNTYLFNNCFTAQDVAPFLTYGTVLDNQKAISALGTFLQNSRYMSVFYQEGYTVIEMEGGPYLSSIYESVRPKRHPQNEIVTLYGAPFDVGILHYASDTPFTKGKNLGTNLSYAGVDPTYATSVAILHRILSKEAERMRAGKPLVTAVT